MQKQAVQDANDQLPGDPIIFIDAVKAKFTGHEPHAAVAKGGWNPENWINHAGEARRIPLEGYHPNHEGHEAYASLLRGHGTFGAESNVQRRVATDIVVVVENTRKMGDNIKIDGKWVSTLSQLQKAWPAIQQRTAEASRGDVRYSLVSFRDDPSSRDADFFDYASRVEVPFTFNPTDMAKGLDGLFPYGGGHPKYNAVLSGLNTGIGQPWRPGVKKLVMLVTASRPHDPEQFGRWLTSADVVKAAEGVDPAEVFAVDTAPDDEADPALIDVVNRTGGELVRVDPATAGDALDELLARALNKPMVIIGDSYSGVPGEQLKFDASATWHPRGALVKYEWDFNMDGVHDVTSTSPLVTYTYPTEYDGTLALRVTDQAGRWSVATASVVITRDGDDYPDSADNCPNDPSPDQGDIDGDGIGDACDPSPFPDQDKPGITVTMWDGYDRDGNSYVDSVKTFTAPNWNLEGDIYGRGDQDAYGLEWSGGEIQLQAVGFSTDLYLYVTDVYGRKLHEASTDGPRSEKLRVTLPAGRYVVFVRASASAQDPAGKYRVKATAIASEGSG